MRALATITLALATALPAAAQPVMYTVMDLGPGSATAINASGQTTGNASGQTFRASPTGQVALLGIGGGGNGINDLGQITGFALTSPTTGYGYLTTPTGNLSTARNLGGESEGFGVNNAGQVVGETVNHGYRAAPGGVFDASADLGALPGDYTNRANAINATGQVTGFSGGAPNPVHPYRTTATGDCSTADDLGTLGGTNAYGYGINSSGQVAGTSYLVGMYGPEHAFRSSPNGQPISLQDLGTLGGTQSTGYGINALGVVVGFSYTDAANTISAGFIYDTSMHNLNTMVPAGWNITQANAINDSGWIAAQGTFNGGSQEAIVLVPVAVPEPSAFLLTAFAAICVASKRPRNRRRRHDGLVMT